MSESTRTIDVYLVQGIRALVDEIDCAKSELGNPTSHTSIAGVAKACEALGYHGLIARPASIEDIAHALRGKNIVVWKEELEIKLGLNKEVLERLNAASITFGDGEGKTVILHALETAETIRLNAISLYEEVLGFVLEVMAEGAKAGDVEEGEPGKEPHLSRWEEMCAQLITMRGSKAWFTT